MLYEVITVAKKCGADAIHPGYGFLSENADFAKACEQNGIIFIGPKPEHIALFGDKMASKVAMRSVGVPVLEGTDEPITDKKEGASVRITSYNVCYTKLLRALTIAPGRIIYNLSNQSYMSILFC